MTDRCKAGIHAQPRKGSCAKCKNQRKRERRLQALGGVEAGQAIACPLCGQLFQVIRIEHAREHGFETTEAFKDAVGLESCASPAQRRRVSKFFKGRPAPHLKIDNHQRGLKRSAESRAKMSAAAVARCLRNPGPIFSTARGEWVLSQKAGGRVFARSSYERRLLWVLDHHPDVLHLQVEPFSIPYTFEGVNRRYIPDFLVLFRGQIRELWEVKPAKFLDDLMNQAKFGALNRYAREHDMNAAIITLENIKRMELAVAAHFALRRNHA